MGSELNFLRILPMLGEGLGGLGYLIVRSIFVSERSGAKTDGNDGIVIRGYLGSDMTGSSS